MAQTLKIPQFVERLMGAIEAKLPNARIELERVGRLNKYRLSVVSPRFRRMDHPKRQNLVWDIAEEVLKPDELLRISMIVTLAPQEEEAVI